MNIIEILQEHRIEYGESGPNISINKGWIGINCPFCGDDSGHHLGIHLKTGHWSCWKDNSHQGATLHYLLQTLLGCSLEATKELLNDRSEFSSIIDRIKAQQNKHLIKEEKEEVLKPDSSLRRLADVPVGGSYLRFWNYMKSRGFSLTETSIAANRYGLLCTLSGQFKNRIVFPVIKDKLVGYAGRCVDGGGLRYLSIPGPIVKRNILWYNDLLEKGGHRLIITEGPFDALKLDFGLYLCGSKDRATCTFGITYTPEQVSLLLSLRRRFKSFIVLFDQGATKTAYKLLGQLSIIRARLGFLPDNAKDPGDLPFKAIEKMVHEKAFA